MSDFHVPIEQVALKVLSETMGEPNRALSTGTELRWGKNGSLSVDLQKNVWTDYEDQTGGGVLDLLRSFRGYSKTEALEWLQDEGFLERSKPKANGAATSDKFAGFMDDHPVAIYEYNDDQGNLAYQILKFPKSAPRRFMQRRPHPSGKGWIWGLKGGLYGQVRSGDWFKAKSGKHYQAEETFSEAARWLYRRDELLNAKDEGRVVVLVEGEKDAETVLAWGICATTNAGGAKYWQASFDDDLTGCDVVICPDNDDAGRDRAVMRGAGLYGKASSVKILDLSEHWEGMSQKADVTDWKENGGTKEQFIELLRQAKPWMPKRVRAFGAYYHDEIYGPGIHTDYVIDGWLASRGRSVMGGPSGSGKSFLALHAAYCIALGNEFFGYHVDRGGVIYQAGEGGIGMKKRQQAYCNHFNIPKNHDVPLVMLPAKVDLFSRDGDTEKLIDAIRQARITMTQPLRVVIIDTLATATIGADENSGKDMGYVLANIARIEEGCGVHVCLVHHMNAGGSKLRGHTSIQANVDTVVLVSKNESTGIRTAKLKKQKDDEEGLEVTFELKQVPIAHNDKTGRDITSCVVMPLSERDQAVREAGSLGFSVRPTEEKILIALFRALDRYGRMATGEANDPPEAVGNVVVDFNYYLDVAVELDPGEETDKDARDRLRKTFARNTDWLVKGKVIDFRRRKGDRPAVVWWTGKPVRGFPHTFPNKSPFGQNPDIFGTKPGQTPDRINEAFEDGEILI